MRGYHRLNPGVCTTALVLALALGPQLTACDDDEASATTGEDPEFDTDLRNPFSVKDKNVVQKGRELFGEHCAGCHNFDGKGRGPESEDLAIKPPTLVNSKAGKQADGWFYTKIWDGIKDSDMPAHEDRLEDEDQCWEIITYLRTLQG